VIAWCEVVVVSCGIGNVCTGVLGRDVFQYCCIWCCHGWGAMAGCAGGTWVIVTGEVGVADGLCMVLLSLHWSSGCIVILAIVGLKLSCSCAGASVTGNVVENGSGRVVAMIVNNALADGDWLYRATCSWLPGIMVRHCDGILGQPGFNFVDLWGGRVGWGLSGGNGGGGGQGLLPSASKATMVNGEFGGFTCRKLVGFAL